MTEQMPKIGEVYERDGLRRLVENVVGPNIYWRRPDKGTVKECWVSTWLEWVSKAKLVESQQ